jgi:hypothetical protein
VFFDEPPDDPDDNIGDDNYWDFPDYEPEWFGNEVTIQNPYGETYSETLAGWHDVTLQADYEIQYSYGMTRDDIIYALQRQDLWDDEDWDWWRENFESP